MSKNTRFRGCFDKQHGKRAQGLLKSASQHLYQIHWLLATKLCSKMSLLLTCQILGLLVNILATNEKYLVLNRNNLTIPTQIQLSEKQKTLSEFFPALLKSKLNLKYFEKKNMTLTAFVFPKLRTLKTWLDKCLKSLVEEGPSESNMVNVPNHCCNLHHRFFTIIIDHWSLPRKFSWKKSLLVTRKILGRLVKTSSADEKYLVLHRDNLMIPIQMQLSQNMIKAL